MNYDPSSEAKSSCTRVAVFVRVMVRAVPEDATIAPILVSHAAPTRRIGHLVIFWGGGFRGFDLT